jgi:hypothetical protein
MGTGDEVGLGGGDDAGAGLGDGDAGGVGVGHEAGVGRPTGFAGLAHARRAAARARRWWRRCARAAQAVAWVLAGRRSSRSAK